MYDTPPRDWPEGTAKIFLGILRDDQADEPERLLAAELAGVACTDTLSDLMRGNHRALYLGWLLAV